MVLIRNGARAFSSTAARVRDATGHTSRVTAVLGSQWGDEGKGKLADVLAADYDIVGRFNGGANAGHTIIANGHRFAFHLLPCGLVYPHTTNVLGNGVVVNLDSLFDELAPLADKGISTTGRLKVSNRAHLLFDFHKEMDVAQEKRRGGSGIGTTKQGIGPAYSSKMSRMGIRVGELLDWDSFVTKYNHFANQVANDYDLKVDTEGELARIKNYREAMLEDDMIIDGVHFVNQKYNEGARIITEGANAALLDVDFGTYPYVTSSTTTAGGLATGMGLSPDKVDAVLGVVKAYTTRVGTGPFPTELTDDLAGGDRERGSYETEIGAHMQKVGAEIGVTTGRKRRCGWLDIPLLQYSNMINSYTGLNITKLDILDDLEEVKIGVAYKINGKRLPAGMMPSTLDELAAVEVEYESMPGWRTSIAKCKTFEELPVEAQNYLNRVAELVGAPITWVGVGPKREEMILINQ